MKGRITRHGHAGRMMVRNWLGGAVAAAMFLGLCCNGAVQAAPAAGDQLVRMAGDQEQVRFALTLPQTNQAGLKEFLQALYTPGNPQFHQFLSSAEFDARFGPTQAQYEALKSVATQNGLTVVGEHTSHTLLDVQGSAGAIRKLLGVQMQVKQRADGRQYFAPDRPQTLPYSLSALGADAAALYQRPLDSMLTRGGPVAQASVDAAARLQPNVGTSPNGAYGPADIKTAYNLNSIQNGGTPVALFELYSANYSDAGVYATEFGLNNPNLVQVAVDGGTTETTEAAEVIADIEMVMLVSNPSTIYVYTGPNTPTGAVDTYTKIADDNLVTQVSTSYGACESTVGEGVINAESPAFTKMVAEGMSLFSAAGDSGAYACSFLLIFESVGVLDPASQPNVIGVGGTNLTTTSTQAYTSETVWNEVTGTAATSGATGGGISGYWPIPSYQKGVVSNAGSSIQYSTTMRNVPDVSLNADLATGGYYIYESIQCKGWCYVGGTSVAAPQWAAFWSLISKGLGSSPGFANPILYSIAENPTSYANDFHDVTSGNNNYYDAAVGYDTTTGWGSYNGANLYAAVIAAVGGGSSSSSSSGGSSSSSSSSSSSGSSSSSSSSSSSGSSSSSSSSSGGSSGVPAAPTLTVTGGGLLSATVSLSWTASSGATSYDVYVGTASGAESSTPVAQVTGTSYQFSGDILTTYYFTVKAQNAAGLSAASNEGTTITGL